MGPDLCQARLSEKIWGKLEYKGEEDFLDSLLKLLLLIITKFSLWSQASCPASQTMAPISQLSLQPAWSWVVFATTLMAAVTLHGLAIAGKGREKIHMITARTSKGAVDHRGTPGFGGK